MPDIATLLSGADLLLERPADWALGPVGDLATDAGLRTALLLSLFTDRTAGAEDVLPDPADADRRGWWGDIGLDGAAPDPIGSRLWLLAREKSTDATRRRAEIYVREALAWMLADGVAAAVDVEAEWQGFARETLALRITIRRRAAAGATASAERFEFAWRAEAAR